MTPENKEIQIGIAAMFTANTRTGTTGNDAVRP